MAEFTWLPTVGFTNEIAPKVKTARFGEGYAQRIPEAINNINNTWSVQFQYQTISTANDIDNFLAARQGAQSFTWLPPGETTEVKVVCTKWSKTYDSSISRSISATFERVYE